MQGAPTSFIRHIQRILVQSEVLSERDTWEAYGPLSNSTVDFARKGTKERS